MKAKDTVMSDKEIKKNLAFIGILTDARLIAKAQAEISFKAGEDKGYAHARQHCEDVIIPQAKAEGMKEVVEWIEINNRITPQVNENRGANIPREVWQAKLKEWNE